MHIETEATQHLQRAAARGARRLARAGADCRTRSATRRCARWRRRLRPQSADILAANAADLAACTGTAAFRDRLTLNEARVEAMAKGWRTSRPARSARPRARRLDAAERPAHPARRARRSASSA